MLSGDPSHMYVWTQAQYKCMCYGSDLLCWLFFAMLASLTMWCIVHVSLSEAFKTSMTFLATNDNQVTKVAIFF